MEKQFKSIRLFLMTLFIIPMLLSCSPIEKTIHQQSFVFGTIVEITVIHQSESKSNQAIQAVLKRFDQLHQELHAWNQTSQLSKINQQIQQGQTDISVSPHILELIQHSKLYESKTQGLFNPTIGYLIQLWGFQNDTFQSKLPNRFDIQKLIDANPSFNNIQIDEKNRRIKVNNTMIRFDFGGIAKGYALDIASTILKQHDIQNALINIGGNVMALGKKGNRPWQVGLQHPRQSGIIGVITLEDGESIGTSGDYQRYFEINQKRYCHILNPKTGYPADQMQSVSVLIQPTSQNQAKTGILSDILSKPLFINPQYYQNHEDHIQNLGIHGTIMIDQSGKIYLNSTMKERFKPL